MTRTASLLALLVTTLLTVSAVSQSRFPHLEATNVAPLLPTAPVRQTDVQAATEQWQSSGVLLQAGDSYLLTASGQWKLAPVCPPTGPDGQGLYNLVCWDIGGQTVPGASHALLIGKIGHDGQPFAVGGNLDLFANATGVLYLMVNDALEWFHDNTGHMRVTLRLLSQAVQSASQPAVQPAPAPEVKRGGGGGGRAPAQQQ